MKSLRPGGGWKGNVGTMSAMPKCLLAENQMLTRTDDTPDINDAWKWVDVVSSRCCQGDFLTTPTSGDRHTTQRTRVLFATCGTLHTTICDIVGDGLSRSPMNPVPRVKMDGNRWLGEMRDRHLRGEL